MKSNKWLLLFYDFLIYLFSAIVLFSLAAVKGLQIRALLVHGALFGILALSGRILIGTYRQMWRYGGVQSYLLMIVSDWIVFLIYYIIQLNIPIQPLGFVRLLALDCLNLLLGLSSRMLYLYVYRNSDSTSRFIRLLARLFRLLGAGIHKAQANDKPKKNVAIIGAGRVGAALAEELMLENSQYRPYCFIDTNTGKKGRIVHGMEILEESKNTLEILHNNNVHEVIFALPQVPVARKKELYEYYKRNGYSVKVYDAPTVTTAGKPKVRDFDIADLLFREPKVIMTGEMGRFYRDKVVLITGGGGSIGSEICRQIAEMQPRKLVILDIAENGAYDVQQNLKIRYGNRLNVCIEIASICDKKALQRIFAEHRPQIVIMAAAHKHVPLMEKNCIEAVKNNVFGTLNTVQVCEEYEVDRVIMVSTDKAVHPTNVMGATKRFCEMIAGTYNAQGGKTTYSMTRFGNVLGSAGSVIPLFRNQIANGGPITVTDKRIIRYFMSIPEAASLVLCSATLGEGSVYVLDMGSPVRILDLAENMIRLSGAEGIEIIETGLRPGEKLYEELLIQGENLRRTNNSMIFVEQDEPLSMQVLSAKLEILRNAVETDDDNEVRLALKRTVPDYRSPEEVNSELTEKQPIAV